MKFIGDFHLHSKYSMATSKHMDLENFDKWAKSSGTIEGVPEVIMRSPEEIKQIREARNEAIEKEQELKNRQIEADAASKESNARRIPAA